MRALITMLLVAVAAPRAGHALDNGLGRTPLLGWSSWNHYGMNVNQTVIRGAIDGLISTGLAAAGFDHVLIDDGWAGSRDVTTHNVIVSPLFGTPSAIKDLADHAHSHGIRLGIYTARGNMTCGHRPGSATFEQLDANQYAEWGVDYLKLDACGGAGPIFGKPAGYRDPDNEATKTLKWRDALNSTGRPIWFMACQDCYMPTNITLGNFTSNGTNAFIFGPCGNPDMASLANSWLVEFCNMVPRFGLDNSRHCSNGVAALPAGVLSAVDALFSMQLLPFAAEGGGVGPTAGGGGWADLDMM